MWRHRGGLSGAVALILLVLVSCAEQREAAETANSRPPAPAFTYLTKSEALQKGGRVLTAEEVKALYGGRTCRGANRNGPLEVTIDQVAGRISGTDGFEGRWWVSEAGETCYATDNQESCQAVILLDGSYYNFDEQGRHRSTIDSCS